MLDQPAKKKSVATAQCALVFWACIQSDSMEGTAMTNIYVDKQ